MPRVTKARQRRSPSTPRSPYTDKKDQADAIPSDHAVPDNLDYDLRVMFVGINPGLVSAARGHHFAGPNNHFWPCLSGSGLVDRPLTYKDDTDLPRLYRLGFTNLTSKTSRKASDLTLNEQQAGVPALTAKIRKHRPRVACFIGKGMYEIFAGEKIKKMGLQPRRIPWDNGKGSTRLFVMPSTSGIVSSYQKADKLQFFQELCRVSAEEDEKAAALTTLR